MEERAKKYHRCARFLTSFLLLSEGKHVYFILIPHLTVDHHANDICLI